MDGVIENEEIEICANGPNLGNSEGVIKEVLDLLWASKS